MSIFVVSLYCIGAFSFISLLFWRLLHNLLKGTSYLQRLHQIPCSRCTYFTGDYRLKCTVHPYLALSEEAIGCRDFELNQCQKNYQSDCPKQNWQKAKMSSN